MVKKRATFKRHATKFPGVYYRIGTHRGTGKPERIFYIAYWRGGKKIEEKAGREKQDDMTASRANGIRTKKIDGDPSRQEKREAIQVAKEAEAGKWTFNRLWEAWQADPENVGKRGTVKADQRYRKHLKVPFGDREPSDLKPLDIDRLRLSLATGHAKATTISVLGLIRRIERYGASKELCAGLSFPIILKGKKLGKDPRIKKAPTDDQVEAYIRTCEEWPDVQAGNFQMFIAYTGVRRGSARNLKWEDLDLDNATAVLKDSKTGDVQIVLSDDAVTLLRSHPETEDVEYVFSGSDPDGKRSQREIDRIPAKIREAAGLPADLDPCHMFRRRLATKVEARFGIAAAMGAGGWRSPAMVINYTATTKATLRDAANLLGRKISEKKSETA
jgi:integrase